MASTDKRWFDVSGLKVGTVNIDDAKAASGGAEGTPVGDGSETDTHANHFLQVVGFTERISIRFADRAAYKSIRSLYLGKGTKFVAKIHKALNSSGNADQIISCASPNAVVVSVNHTDEFNAIGDYSAEILFKSPDGISLGAALT